jgi:hypothetical protein
VALNGGPSFSSCQGISLFVDAQREARVTKAMLQVSKIDIDGLRRAYEGG